MSWETICTLNDLPNNAGAGALVQGIQIAIFRLGDDVYALDNHCPFSQANVLARGIVGDLQGEPCVASPIYKQHFSLRSGRCFEDDTVQVKCYPVQIRDATVEVSIDMTKVA